ncbi:antirestriction protein ArdA [Schaalia sp. Marseille-Q2122]|uniref:antirestriction protein ArdA n=1 Tax=Schaalia sp. Marseille-Q2122 TaxID=2736604 RepID=UPI00158B07DB
MNMKNMQEALELWIDSGMAVLDEDGAPSLTGFEDAYRGWWESFRDYLAEEVAELQRDWLEEAVRYFNWDLYERDAQHDYTLCEAQNGGVHVFLDL